MKIVAHAITIGGFLLFLGGLSWVHPGFVLAVIGLLVMFVCVWLYPSET